MLGPGPCLSDEGRVVNREHILNGRGYGPSQAAPPDQVLSEQRTVAAGLPSFPASLGLSAGMRLGMHDIV